MKLIATITTAGLLLTGNIHASSIQGERIQGIGVKAVPMGRTVKGVYLATAKKGECFVVKNGKVFYTTDEIAEKYKLKKYRNSYSAKQALEREDKDGE